MNTSITNSWGMLAPAAAKNQSMAIFSWLGVIFLLFGVVGLSSKFVMAPGLDVSLPQVKGPLSGVSTNYVLTLGAAQTFFWEGRVHSWEELVKALKVTLKARSGDSAQAVLLIKANACTDLQTFLNVCELARHSGFTNIQIAAQYAQ